MTTSTKKRSPPSSSVHDANDLLFHWNDDQDLSIVRTACLFFRVITIQLANAQTEESRRMILDLISISCYSSIFLKPYRISLTCNYSPRKEREEWFHSFKFLTTPPSLIKTRSIKSRINCNLRREGKKGEEEEEDFLVKRERETDPSITDERGQFFPSEEERKIVGGKKRSVSCPRFFYAITISRDGNCLPHHGRRQGFVAFRLFSRSKESWLPRFHREITTRFRVYLARYVHRTYVSASFIPDRG